MFAEIAFCNLRNPLARKSGACSVADMSTEPPPQTITFTDQLVAERKRLGLTQAECAAVLDIPPRCYWDIERAASKRRQWPVTEEGILARLKKRKSSKKENAISAK
jgi:hypothetical protein